MQVIQYFETFRQFNSQDALDSSLAILRELKRCTSTESEAFSLFLCLDANKFVLLSFFSLIKTIYPRVSTKPLPVDVRRSNTFLSDACQPEVRPSPFFICLDANKFVLLSFFSLIKTIYPRVWTKPLPSDSKSPLPVDVRRSKTLLLKLRNDWFPGLSLVYLVILCFWVKDSPLILTCEQALHSGKSREVTRKDTQYARRLPYSPPNILESLACRITCPFGIRQARCTGIWPLYWYINSVLACKLASNSWV